MPYPTISAAEFEKVDYNNFEVKRIVMDILVNSTEINQNIRTVLKNVSLKPDEYTVQRKEYGDSGESAGAYTWMIYAIKCLVMIILISL